MEGKGSWSSAANLPPEALGGTHGSVLDKASARDTSPITSVESHSAVLVEEPSDRARHASSSVGVSDGSANGTDTNIGAGTAIGSASADSSGTVGSSRAAVGAAGSVGISAVVEDACVGLGVLQDVASPVGDAHAT